MHRETSGSSLSPARIGYDREPAAAGTRSVSHLGFTESEPVRAARLRPQWAVVPRAVPRAVSDRWPERAANSPRADSTEREPPRSRPPWPRAGPIKTRDVTDTVTTLASPHRGVSHGECTHGTPPPPPLTTGAELQHSPCRPAASVGCAQARASRRRAGAAAPHPQAAQGDYRPRRSLHTHTHTHTSFHKLAKAGLCLDVHVPAIPA
jgi:hypothetical protein